MKSNPDLLSERRLNLILECGEHFLPWLDRHMEEEAEGMEGLNAYGEGDIGEQLYFVYEKPVRETRK